MLVNPTNNLNGSLYMRRAVSSFFAPIAILLSGCGPTEGLHDEAAISESSLTAPPSGVGFVNDGVGHLKNGTGTCAYKNGTALSSAACANVANQLFVYYRVSDGRYHLCVPETLKYNTGTRWVSIGGRPQQWVEYQAYTATCLNKNSSSNALRFDALTELAAAYKIGGTYSAYAPSPGRISIEEKLVNGNILGWVNSTLKVTQTSSGAIELASKSVAELPTKLSSLRQQWTVY
jgi:hypothetical protein